MLRFTKGDMFETPADIRVNTVNCVGVMGAGVALAFKTRYPEMFREYKKECDDGQLHPGKLHVWENLTGDWVINFPTKRHWRDKSRYEDIESGLIALREYLSREKGVRVTLPALGCGHGGLDWTRVAPMIREKLEGLDAEIVVFEPADSRAAGDKVHEELERKEAALLETKGIKTMPFTGAGASTPWRTHESDRTYFRGDGSLVHRTFISFASSSAPDDREKDAALACMEALARDGIVFSLNYDEALSSALVERAIEKGAKVVVWVSEGLMSFRVPDRFQDFLQDGSLAVVSLAKPRQKWKRELFEKTQLANLASASVGLITEPQPFWLRANQEGVTDWLNKHLFYLNYRDSDQQTKNRLRKLSAKPLGRNPETKQPNVSPILEIIANSTEAVVETHSKSAHKPPLAEQAHEPAPMREEKVAYKVMPPTEKQQRYPRRLIEVDLPIKRISAHARREKSIRHGHISTLHIWWARRPLAACRAVICAALWPDPADFDCPPEFREAAAKAIVNFARRIVSDTDLATEHCSPENFKVWRKVVSQPEILNSQPTELRSALLHFIADFANWDNSTVREYLDTSRALTQAAHEALGGAPGTRPLVVDPFAGGGSIPLEALRVGADAFASDLNPVPVLLNKVVLEYIPKYGQRLADEVRKWGEWIKREAEKELAEFYPKDADGATPIAYLWARTIQCEGPGCGAEVPLFRSLWLAKKGKRSVALKINVNSKQKRLEFEIQSNAKPAEVGKGTCAGGSATCPICGYTTPVESVRIQLAKKQGGASDARLISVVTNRPNEVGQFFRAPTEQDEKAVEAAKAELKRRVEKSTDALPLIPDGQINHLRGFFNIVLYGITEWGHIFSPRQALTLTTFARLVRELPIKTATGDSGLTEAVKTCLGLLVDRVAVRCTSNCIWDATTGCIMQVFNQGQALPARWEFAEMSPCIDSGSGWATSVDYTIKVLDHCASIPNEGHAERASATTHPLPTDSAQAVITDPPYYAAIPYADLSDFFFSLLKRSLFGLHDDLLKPHLTEKKHELVSLSHRAAMYREKDNLWFEQQMGLACGEARRVCEPSGLGVVVFANKETAAWEAMLAALISAGWVVTASWPIDTESGNRLRAKGSAALASSVHLVCRPRENPDGSVRTDEIGDWRDVLQELPRRIHEWMPRLAEEGVVGADAIFACLGPALEIFSRYSRVEKASGEAVTLKEYLEQVWAAVAKEALTMIFTGADTTGFEEDARLTAMWLWTLNAGSSNGEAAASDDGEGEDDEEFGGGGKSKGGFVLEYDAARKIAQGLGAHLEDLGSLVEVNGEQARLLPVGERARHLFGKEEGKVTSTRKKKLPQLDLFKVLEQAEESGTTFGETKVERQGDTVLDRIHQSMILFAAGRSEALKRFLVEDGAGRDQRFWRLAQALSALYPSQTEEKRWVDGVLARKKGLGF